MIAFGGVEMLVGVPPDEARQLLQTPAVVSPAEKSWFIALTRATRFIINKGRFAITVVTPLDETATIATRGPVDNFGRWGSWAGDGDARQRLGEAETFSVSLGPAP